MTSQITVSQDLSGKMSLSSSQQKRCLEVMDKLCSRRTSQMFALPVDPDRDNCPNYFDVVKTPMDLGTVRKKLNAGQYKTVADWKADVNLIWSNSNSYNSKTSILRCITKDLSDFYHKLTSFLTDSPQNDWTEELNFLTNEMNQIMKDMSDPINDVIPIPAPNPLPSSHPPHEKKPKSQTKIRNSNSSSGNQKPPPIPQIQTATVLDSISTSSHSTTTSNPSSAAAIKASSSNSSILTNSTVNANAAINSNSTVNTSTSGLNQPIQTRQKTKSKQNANSNSSEIGEQERVVFKEEKKHSRPFSKDQLQILSHDINALEDDLQVSAILDLIKKNEADIKDNGGEIEVDLNTLRSSTLRLLREKVDAFMEENFL